MEAISESKSQIKFKSITDLGFYTTPQKYIKKNSDRLNLGKILKRFVGEKHSFTYTSPYSYYSCIVFLNENTSLVLVVSDKYEVVYQKRFYNSKNLNLINCVSRDILAIKTIIDDVFICSYTGCSKTPRIAKNKNGKLYWFCPGNYIHKKNQYKN